MDSKIDLIIEKLTEIDERVKRLEGKTNDMHKFVPFVGWLESVGKKITFMNWIKGSKDLPQLLDSKEKIFEE